LDATGSDFGEPALRFLRPLFVDLAQLRGIEAVDDSIRQQGALFGGQGERLVGELINRHWHGRKLHGR